jgi:hypothetical protein
MKWNQFFGGVLVGGALGLMVGGAIVQVPADGNGERKYPVFLSTMLAVAGVGVAGIRRASGERQHGEKGEREKGES